MLWIVPGLYLKMHRFHCKSYLFLNDWKMSFWCKYILHHVAVLFINFTMLLLTIFWSFTLSNTYFMWYFIVRKMVILKVISLALLFIIRIRFPADKSIAHILRSRYGNALVKEVSKLEKIDYKLRKCRLDIVFLETCLNNNIIPTFLSFRVTNLKIKNITRLLFLSNETAKGRYICEKVQSKDIWERYHRAEKKVKRDSRYNWLHSFMLFVFK